MLTLITGVPGAGKGLYSVELIVDFLKRFPDRKIYSNIRELKLQHEPLDPLRWMDAAPGSIIFIDEAQRWFKGEGRNLPQHIRDIDVHRETYGVDIFMITQSANSLDMWVRDRVGEHRHLHRAFLRKGATITTAQECFDPRFRTKIEGVQRQQWKHPKALYALYKSTSFDTMGKSRLPVARLAGYGIGAVAAVAALVIAVAFMHHQSGPPARKNEISKKNGARDLQQQKNQPGALEALNAGRMPASGAGHSQAEMNAFWTKAHWTPRLPDHPESAAVFDEVYRVRSAPVVAGCMSWKSKQQDDCTCTDQQGARIRSMETAACEDWIKYGVFDPTGTDDYRKAAATATAAAKGLPTTASAAFPTPESVLNPHS